MFGLVPGVVAIKEYLLHQYLIDVPFFDFVCTDLYGALSHFAAPAPRIDVVAVNE